MRRFAPVPVLFLFLLCGSAVVVKADAPPPVPKPTRVMLVSIDGWHPALLDAKYMPETVKLMKRGSWTKRAVTPMPAVTVVSHAEMLTGAPPETNGVTKFEPKSAVDGEWRPLKVKTVFDALKSSGKEGTAVVQKRKLYGLVPKESARHVYFVTNDEWLVHLSCAEMMWTSENSLVFVHVAGLDSAGHSSGWLSPRQKKAARYVDTQIARLARCVERSEKETGSPAALIVTADHGGHKKTHGKVRESDGYVPWIAVGAGIKANHEIAGEVRLMDTAATVRRLLGLNELTLPDAQGKVVRDIFVTP